MSAIGWGKEAGWGQWAKLNSAIEGGKLARGRDGRRHCMKEE